jgi:hypothetical protein
VLPEPLACPLEGDGGFALASPGEAAAGGLPDGGGLVFAAPADEADAAAAADVVAAAAPADAAEAPLAPALDAPPVEPACAAARRASISALIARKVFF